MGGYRGVSLRRGAGGRASQVKGRGSRVETEAVQIFNMQLLNTGRCTRSVAALLPVPPPPPSTWPSALNLRLSLSAGAAIP
jgi:hypothetical protein